VANKRIAIGIMILAIGCDAIEATDDTGRGRGGDRARGATPRLRARAPCGSRPVRSTCSCRGGDFTIYTRRFTEATKSWSSWVQVEGAGVVGSGARRGQGTPRAA